MFLNWFKHCRVHYHLIGSQYMGLSHNICVLVIIIDFVKVQKQLHTTHKNVLWLMQNIWEPCETCIQLVNVKRCDTVYVASVTISSIHESFCFMIQKYKLCKRLHLIFKMFHRGGLKKHIFVAVINIVKKFYIGMHMKTFLTQISDCQLYIFTNNSNTARLEDVTVQNCYKNVFRHSYC